MTDEAQLREKLRKIEALFAGADTVGEKLGMVGAVGDDELHAASATGASRVSTPQHSALSFTPSVVPRTFMDPPHAPGS